MSDHEVQKGNDEENMPQVLVSDISPDMKNFNVQFRVISVGVVRKISSRSSRRQHLISEVVIGDRTGIITLVLWNEDVDSLTPGSTYSLSGGIASIYDDCLQLGKAGGAEIIPLEKVIEHVDMSNNMSRPFALLPSGKRRRRSKMGRSMSGEQGREAKGYCTWKGF